MTEIDRQPPVFVQRAPPQHLHPAIMPTGDSDTSSLHTVTDSLQQKLYRYKGDRRMQALNEDYKSVPDCLTLRPGLS